MHYWLMKTEPSSFSVEDLAAAAVEPHERQEHHIEPAGREYFAALGFGNAEAVVLQGTSQRHEAHGA